MNTNENIINYKYENSNLNAITINNNGKNVTYSLGGGSGTSGTFDSKTITANGTYDAANDSLDGYDEVTVNVPDINIQATKNVTITENKTTVITPDSGYDAIDKINVDVDIKAYKTFVSDYSGFINFTDTRYYSIQGHFNFDFDGRIVFARLQGTSVVGNPTSVSFTSGTEVTVSMWYTYVFNIFIMDNNGNIRHAFYVDMHDVYNG